MSWREAERTYTDDVIGEDPIPSLFEASADRFSDRLAQRYKGGVYDRSLSPEPIPPAPDGEFAGLTYGELQHIVRRLTAGFRDLGLAHGDRVAIFSSTRMEWAQTDFALLAAGGIVTTIYANATERMVTYQLDDAGAVGVVVEDEDKLERVLAVADDLDLSFIVTIDEVDVETDHEVYSLGDVFRRGQETFERATYDEWVDAVEPDDLASIIYTSGTTGPPKGVQLTHANLRANINQVRKRYAARPDKAPDLPVIDETTSSVSFLPLAHIFERTAGHFFMFASGGTVAYAESPDTLQEDFQAVRPTVATSVPRVYEKIYKAINEQAQSSPVKARIFAWAVDVGRAYHRAEDPGTVLGLKQSLADKLVFGKVKDALGGNIEMLISGGGSLSANLCALYHGMGLPIYEGYGLTETAPVATTNPVEEPQIGTIGLPVVDMEVRLDPSSVPAGDIEGEAGEIGELLLRGPNVSPGYWNRPDATAEAFDEDGWLRTGDIVRQQPDDYLVFIDRVKELIVLSTGKNVAPGPIEDAFVGTDLVEQCMVIGNDEKFIGALIVPSVDGLAHWADAEDIDLPESPAAICKDSRVRTAIAAEVESVNADLEAVETIKDFRLVPEEFTEENDMLTPTMKKKRRNILDAYREEVEQIYAED